MKVTGTAEIGIKIKEVNITQNKEEYCFDDIFKAIETVEKLPYTISSIVNKLYDEGLILWKRDLAVIHHYVKDRNIYPHITYVAFAKIIAMYSNLPKDKKPSDDNLSDISIFGDFPNWRIRSIEDPLEHERLLKLAIRFHELWISR